MTSCSASLDIFEVFSDTIESFRSRQAKITELIWSYQIECEGIDNTEGMIDLLLMRLLLTSIVLDLKTLSTWLAPPDRVLASLSRDHTTFADDQAEHTCLWFQSHLSQFIKSNKKYFSITGPSGSGKTVLAGSIADRLQRPMGRKSFDTLFFSISKFYYIGLSRPLFGFYMFLTSNFHRLGNSVPSYFARHDKVTFAPIA